MQQEKGIKMKTMLEHKITCNCEPMASNPGRGTQAQKGWSAVGVLAGLCVLASGLVGCVSVSAPDPLVLKTPNCDSRLTGLLTGESVIVMPPQISLVRTEDEAPVTAEESGSDGLAELMVSTARSALAKNGIKVVEFNSLDADRSLEVGSLLGNVQKRQSGLARNARRDDETLTQLRSLAKLTGAKAILLQKARVNLGVEAGHDQQSGQMWHGTSSTTIRTSLVSLETGGILWGKEMFMRALPSDKRCSATLTRMYSDDADKKGGNQ